ncbi:S-layer homology domain-containing protein [Synechocystis sp. LKSZ1]|uniref:S-layer homology domain-containing protein n=1 Tax=Synechocystis sp. LKSZ1 TaxID=3144951 RepID=UPI00336BB5B0
MPSLMAQQMTITFSDIDRNVYKSEILQAAQLGIVQGFPDGTFRPNQPVTREQAVSMIVDAINTLTPVDLKATPTAPVRPFTDIDSSRWSAAKISWAQWNIWPAGTPTGKFRPTDNITRAEMVSFLRRAAERIKINLGRSPALTPTQKPLQFSDVSGFNQQLTLQMSAYCRVASPVNEKENKFAPNQPANRDYAAAAIIRTLNCVKNDNK